MLVVCNVNSYERKEYRMKATKFNISNVLHQFRKVEFFSKIILAVLALTVTCKSQYFAQRMHLAEFGIDYFCCHLPCFFATSYVVTGQYILLH